MESRAEKWSIRNGQDECLKSPTMGGWSALSVLAGLALGLTPFGTAFDISIDSRVFVITYSMLVTVLAWLLLLARALDTGAAPLIPSKLALWLFAMLISMLIPVLLAPDTGAAAGGYMSFAWGALAGFAIFAVVRSVSQVQFGALDAGMVVFLVWTAYQILSLLGDVDAVWNWHEAAILSWGRHNYVAGVLSIVALFALARAREFAGSLRIVLFISAILGLAGVAATMSRGGILAAVAGLAVYVYRSARSTTGKVLTLTIALVILGTGVWAFEYVTQLRSMRDAQAEENIAGRVRIWSQAISHFVDSPLTGTGWLAMRGDGGTYAHNLVLSFLQIGGLVGMVVVIAPVTVLALRGLRYGGHYAGPLAAAMVFGASDPLLEGTVGGMATFAVLLIAATVPRESVHSGEVRSVMVGRGRRVL